MSAWPAEMEARITEAIERGDIIVCLARVSEQSPGSDPLDGAWWRTEGGLTR